MAAIPTNLGRKQVFTLIIWMLSVNLLFLAAIWLASKPLKISAIHDSTSVDFEESRGFVFPGQCIILTWHVAPAVAVSVDNIGQDADGTRQVCLNTTTDHTLSVGPSGTKSVDFMLTTEVPFSSAKSRSVATLLFCLAILLLFAAADLGEIPYLSRQIRRRKSPRRYWQFIVWEGKGIISREIKWLIGQPALLRAQAKDVLAITLLLLIAAIPFFVFRSTAWTNVLAVVSVSGPVIIVWIGIFIYWLTHRNAASNELEHWQPFSSRKVVFKDVFFKGLFLLSFIVIAFCIRLNQHFWVGQDEGVGIALGQNPFLENVAVFDSFYGRPLATVSIYAALKLTPDNVDGFLWLTILLRGSSALLIYGILRNVMKGSKSIAWIAAILYVVNPSEPARYLAVTMQIYFMAVFLLLLAIYLFILSYQHHVKWMLSAACLVLGISLLTCEAGFPPALLGLLLLTFGLPKQKHYSVWLYSWIMTLALLTAHFILFLKNSNSNYQSGYVGGALTTPAQLLTNLSIQLWGSLTYIVQLKDLINTPTMGFVYGGLAMLLTIMFLYPLTRKIALRPLRFMYLRAILLSSGAVVLGVVAYITIFSIFRTQFYAAPAQAALWAIIIAWIGAYLPRFIQRFWLVFATGIIVLASVSVSMQLKEPDLNPSVRFEKSVQVFQQVHRLAPNFTPSTLILFVLDDPKQTPLGYNYQVMFLARTVLGVDGYQVNNEDPYDRPEFSAEGITLRSYTSKIELITQKFSYSQIVAFALSKDNTVTLLKEFPHDSLPPDVHVSGYNPASRIIQGEVVPLRFLN